MRTIVSNSSWYPDYQVRWLVEFAAAQVEPVARREGWLTKLLSKPTSVRVMKSRHHSGSGRYLACPEACRIGKPFRRPADIQPYDKVRDTWVKLGTPDRYPRKDVYARFKDMPEGVFNDWCECLIGIAAHEIAHTQYSGLRDGEYNCELVSQDAVIEFRKRRAEFDEFCARHLARNEARETAMAAKQSPEAVLNKKLADAQKRLLMWERKSKLATTKLKKYTRLVKRLSNKQQPISPGS